MRYRGGEASAVMAATKVFAAEAGRTPFVRVHTIENNMRDMTSRERLLAWLFSAMAALAAAISATGLAGLLAYGVEQRRREFGIRMALGSSATAVRRLIVGHGLRLAFTGLLLGGFVCYPLRHALDAFLYGVSPAEPRIWIVAAGVTLLASLAATAGPAHRAGRVDPVRVLRND